MLVGCKTLEYLWRYWTEEMITVSQSYRGQNSLTKEVTTTEAVETTASSYSLHTEPVDHQNPVTTKPVTLEPVSQMGIEEEGDMASLTRQIPGLVTSRNSGQLYQSCHGGILVWFSFAVIKH